MEAAGIEPAFQRNKLLSKPVAPIMITLALSMAVATAAQNAPLRDRVTLLYPLAFIADLAIVTIVCSACTLMWIVTSAASTM